MKTDIYHFIDKMIFIFSHQIFIGINLSLFSYLSVLWKKFVLKILQTTETLKIAKNVGKILKSS